MVARSKWGISPGESVRRECERRGRRELVAGCIDLLNGRDADPELIYALGGPPARWAVTGGEGGPAYWLQVWAARGLLYEYDDAAEASIVAALRHEQWRVREMASRVCARQRIEAALPELEALKRDVNVRVRRAAERATLRIAAAG